VKGSGVAGEEFQGSATCSEKRSDCTIGHDERRWVFVVAKFPRGHMGGIAGFEQAGKGRQ